MKRLMYVILLLFLVSFAAEPVVLAQDFFIYPTKGQNPEQQKKDEFECYNWAKQQSGFDPMQAPQATAPPPQRQAKKGGAVRGAVIGGAAGAGIGAISGDGRRTGKGAAIGAGAGALMGGMRRQRQMEKERQAQDQWAQDQSNQYMQRRNTYNRAYGACLEGRGYTVK